MSTNNRIGRNPFDKKPKASHLAPESSKAAQSPEITPSKKTAPSTKTKKAKKLGNASEAVQPEFVLKVSDKKAEAATKHESALNPETSIQLDAQVGEPEEQIIGELIDLPEENWQPLTAVPAQFIKQLLSRWI
jgi:hypothetical protein